MFGQTNISRRRFRCPKILARLALESIPVSPNKLDTNPIATYRKGDNYKTKGTFCREDLRPPAELAVVHRQRLCATCKLVQSPL